MHLFYDFLGTENEISNFEASLWWVFPNNWEPVINISWLKNEQVKLCFFTLESPYPYFCCNLRHNVMPYMYSEMKNKLSKIRESPLESMGQIISSRCPKTAAPVRRHFHTGKIIHVRFRGWVAPLFKCLYS